MVGLEDLNIVLKNEPSYRIKQVKKAIFQDLIEDWMEATNLPLSLRRELNQKFPLSVKAELFSLAEKEVQKARIALADNLKIESVLMRHQDGRNTVCVSSQVGCPSGCKFCATGKMGWQRDLSALEIISQVLFFARLLKSKKQKVTNLVLMGMGEPFLNYDEVMKAIRLLNSKESFNLGARHISISTVGIVEGIRKLSDEKLQLNLAFSLHAPNNELRGKLIPLNRKYPLETVLKAIDDYIRKTKRRVMLEYLLIKDVNDSDCCMLELSALVKRNPLYFLNLILYNPTGSFEPSSYKRVKRCREILTKQKVNFTQRYRFGEDLKAACGQLATEKKRI